MTAGAGDYAALAPAARDVLDFWFGEPGSARFGKEWDRWFDGDEGFDATLGVRFGKTLEAARRGDFDDWERSPLGTLALIVVLDQFSRNIHRGSAEAFAGDARALAAARRMVESGADRRLPSAQHRAFVYMPFEHDESRESQELAVRLFEALERVAGLTGYLRYARRHAEIIERFGRFPHRNAMLGRRSTDAERDFLSEPGSSFR
ncbi:DUF924 domain-containing protein [Trinickia symbiotica]|uniref:DUF924 domain-containing protein n=1 Tax=Trinickia symbiotica TaxID=863227 RepID=A0A2T3XS62_9BURK|nr:DUF924 family protein [Trinickia symbiotica]PTB19363.1 DUF924 domain-containing protein [Trinickia symbiotica]